VHFAAFARPGGGEAIARLAAGVFSDCCGIRVAVYSAILLVQVQIFIVLVDGVGRRRRDTLLSIIVVLQFFNDTCFCIWQLNGRAVLSIDRLGLENERVVRRCVSRIGLYGSQVTLVLPPHLYVLGVEGRWGLLPPLHLVLDGNIGE